MTKILGIKYGGHDTSAAVMINGKIIAACAQERFSLDKHSRKFPIDAIKECLKMQEDVKDEISTIFKNISVSGPNVYSHAADPSDRSTTTHYEWSLKNSIIEVVCYDFVEPVKIST